MFLKKIFSRLNRKLKKGRFKVYDLNNCLMPIWIDNLGFMPCGHCVNCRNMYEVGIKIGVQK